ncbi:DUF3558 domain-containing protein [Actinosynnema sp. CS-041913]|uniref:DUF3558 domain-containing protein n=1 Tax=Actinosynnema sp. CS-041913 TaxID=3239917 RepID=UPI003D8BE998
MNRTIRTVLVVGAVTAALAACTSKEVGGNPTSAPATDTSSAKPTESSSPSSNEPTLDIEKFVSAPCTILTQAQQTALGTFREAKAGEDGVNGPSCTYQGKDVLENSSFTIVLAVKGNTFDDAVKDGDTKFPVFQETKIEGYRAASFDGTDGKRHCNTAIRTSDRTFVLIQGSIAKNDTKLNDGKACGTTERVAATVIGNLKG